MKKYIELQMKFIHLYAKHMNIDDESAALLWVNLGLAEHFSEIYKKTLNFKG